MPASLQTLLPSLESKPLTQSSQTGPTLSPSFGLLDLVHTNFTLTTWLSVGACLQTLAIFTIPNIYYATLPTLLLLLFRTLDALLIHFNLKPNPFLEESFPRKRLTAVIPNEDGELVAPGVEKVAVILLGAKSNHPFGVLSPEFLKTFKLLAEMNAGFDGEDGPGGFLGQTNWQRKDHRNATEFCFLSYWRSIPHIHAFAHSDLHRAAWRWWETTIKAHDCVGLFHEIYEAEPGHWENLYLNFQPTGIGATTYLKRQGKGRVEGGEVKGEWVSGLIDASKGRYKLSSARMGVGETRFDGDSGRPDGDIYGG